MMEYKIIENHPNDSRVKYREDNIFQTLSSRMGTGGGNVPMIQVLNDQGGSSMSITEDKTGTLRAEEHGHQPIVNIPTIGVGVTNNIAGTLDSSYYKGQGVRGGIERTAVFWDGGQTCSTLTANNAGGSQRMPDKNHFNGVVDKKTVRRLTPIECERLQGWPDNYTDVPLNSKPASDSARYKALGNGMAQPCARWIIQRIVDVAGGA